MNPPINFHILHEHPVSYVLWRDRQPFAKRDGVDIEWIVILPLGFLIWLHWPSSSVWVIGALVGISLIFSGISRVMLSLAVRRLTPTTA